MFELGDIFIPLAAAIVVGLAWRGFLSERRLADAPPRDVPLRWIDLLGGLALPLLSTAGALVVHQFASSEPAPQTQPALSVSWAVNALFGQILVQLPAIALLMGRAHAVPDGARRVGWRSDRPGRDLQWGLLGLLVGVPLVFGVTQAAVHLGTALGQPKPDHGHVLLKMLRESPSVAATVLMIFGAVVLAPLLEEITFRGLAQTALGRLWSPHRRWPVILVASAIFAAVHGPAVAWQALPALFALGVVMGWLYEKTGSLWPSIVLHMGFNATNVALMFLAGENPL